MWSHYVNLQVFTNLSETINIKWCWPAGRISNNSRTQSIHTVIAMNREAVEDANLRRLHSCNFAGSFTCSSVLLGIPRVANSPETNHATKLPHPYRNESFGAAFFCLTSGNFVSKSCRILDPKVDWERLRGFPTFTHGFLQPMQGLLVCFCKNTWQLGPALPIMLQS